MKNKSKVQKQPLAYVFGIMKSTLKKSRLHVEKIVKDKGTTCIRIVTKNTDVTESVAKTLKPIVAQHNMNMVPKVLSPHTGRTKLTITF